MTPSPSSSPNGSSPLSVSRSGLPSQVSMLPSRPVSETSPPWPPPVQAASNMESRIARFEVRPLAREQAKERFRERRTRRMYVGRDLRCEANHYRHGGVLHFAPAPESRDPASFC